MLYFKICGGHCGCVMAHLTREAKEFSLKEKHTNQEVQQRRKRIRLGGASDSQDPKRLFFFFSQSFENNSVNLKKVDPSGLRSKGTVSYKMDIDPVGDNG